MKKIVINGAALFAVALLASCQTSQESAYRKAYEKAKAQEEIVEQQPQNIAQPVQQQYVQQQPQQQYVQQQPQYQQQVANDNVPVRQERLTVVNGVGLKAFSVVVGSFGVKANAEGLQRTLVNSGYSAQVAYNQDRNMYRVIASTYDTKQDAIMSRDNLSANYPGAWLLYNNN